MPVAALSVAQMIPYKYPKSSNIPTPHRILVRQVALRCLAELAVSLAIGTTALLFTAGPIAASLIFGAIAVQTVCNVLLRYYGALAAELEKNGKGDKETQRILAACNYLCPTTFAYMSAINGQTLIHETGHAIAARAVYKNACPKIILHPLKGGLTTFSTHALTDFGKKLGKARAICFITAMGPASTLLISAIAIVIGYTVQAKLPELSNYLVSVGSGDFYTHAWYALTSFGNAALSAGHDFDRLAAHGLHPLVAAVAILAVPFFLAWAFRKTEGSASEIRG